MMNKKRILFVDDEARILAGLRRMLRPMRHQWEMAFATCGPEALAKMAENPFDIIVSDMRMPGMDGAQLLQTVMERHPQTIRIVLSGQADRDSILSAVGPIHQYLSKPCDAGTLKSTLTRASALDQLLPNDELRQLIARMETLPSLPCLYEEVLGKLESKEASATAIGEIISRDMGMSVKVLQLVNSAFFGLRPHIPSPTQAVILLGLDTVKILGLSVQAFSRFEQVQLERLSLSSLWRHSEIVGAFAGQIAAAEGAEQKVIDYAFIAGLLHDVGKLVLAAHSTEKYDLALSRAIRENLGLLEAEREVLGATHAEVGAYLLGLWGLPEPVVDALSFSHAPGRYALETFNPATAVHVADALERELDPSGAPGRRSEIDHDYLARLGLAERLPVWRDICSQQFQREGI